MHSRERVDEALALAAQGVNACEIARRIGVPRSTVRDWIRDAQRHHRRSRQSRCARCGGEAHKLSRLPPEYTYLLGLYLGDGCLSRHRRDVYKLRITLDTRYPGIVDACEDSIRHVMPSVRVGRYPRGGGPARAPTHVEVYAYSKSWPCLFPQHGPGPKHLRPIALVDWQGEHVVAQPELLVRGLIHSDGCRFINTGTNWRHPRYVFTNLSGDIRQIFRDGCELLGVHHTAAPNNVYVSRKADVAMLDRFIGPKR